MNLQTFSTNIIYAAVFYQKEKNMKKKINKKVTHKTAGKCTSLNYFSLKREKMFVKGRGIKCGMN